MFFMVLNYRELHFQLKLSFILNRSQTEVSSLIADFLFKVTEFYVNIFFVFPKILFIWNVLYIFKNINLYTFKICTIPMKMFLFF